MVAQSDSRQPIVIPRPAVPDGSNASRAPFPAKRQMDDIQRPNGEAIDRELPPNTPASEEPLNPPVRVAIFQSQPAAQPVEIAPSFGNEPALAMTGRPSAGVAVSLEAARIAPALRAQPMAGRETLLRDIEARVKAAEKSRHDFRATTQEMNPDAREQFRTASDAMESREKALRKSLRAAEKANDAEWEGARTQLAADYEAFAAAAAQLDAVTGMPAVQH